jgi:hypothetical protein
MTRQPQSAGSEKEPLQKRKFSEQEAKEGTEESCRCKEVAKKTPFEMLRLMINDLAFWKKQKGNNPKKND